MPHLCSRMRRLTSKDVAKRKLKGEVPVPDLYALSRNHGLPELTSEDAPDFMQGVESVGAVSNPLASSLSLAEVELAILEKKRAAIMERINELVGAHALAPKQAASVVPRGQAHLGPQDLLALQQQLSAQRNAAGNPSTFPPDVSAFFQQQQQQQPNSKQWDIASIITTLSEKTVPSASNAPSASSSEAVQPDLMVLLQQAGLAAILKQQQQRGRDSGATILAQLLQSTSGGGAARATGQMAPLSAPAVQPPAVAYPAQQQQQQQMSSLGGIHNAHLLSGASGSNAELHRQVLEARLAGLRNQTSAGRQN